MAPLNVLSGRPSVSAPSVHVAKHVPHAGAGASIGTNAHSELGECCRFQGFLPEVGRRSLLWAADEHAARPRSCRSMLRQHMLIMHVDRVESKKNADFVHALCARETSYAYTRLYTWSGQLVLLLICVGPPVAAVPARCEGPVKSTWGS